MSDPAARAFWAWFAATHHELAQGFDGPAATELDRRIDALGFMWELGPGQAQPCALTISPDGDPQRLDATTSFVALAPRLDGWEFYPARRRRPILEFTFECAQGHPARVDPTTWRYALRRHRDGMFELDIFLSESLLDEECAYSAAAIAVDGAIGERARLTWFCQLHAMLPTRALPAQTSAFTTLAQHLTALGFQLD